MVDGSFASTSTAHANGRPAAFATTSPPGPPGYAIRRAATGDDMAHPRRRSALNPAAQDVPFGERRRSSVYSEYSMNEARRSLEAGTEELLNAEIPGTASGRRKSLYSSAPIIFALLPAVGGMLFQNGSAFFTDVILLGLAAVFLHWSVTQPWNWYAAAQQIRVVNSNCLRGEVFDSDSDLETPSPAASATTAPETPFEDDGKEKNDSPETPHPTPAKSARKQWEERKAAEVKQLYHYEMYALIGCFAFPVVAAYLLHQIRSQLSRPSEGLVSDYNLSIFLIAAEVRPFSHIIQLVQSHTLHLQRLVATNPYDRTLIKDQQVEDVYARLNALEARAVAGEEESGASVQTEDTSFKAMEAVITRNIRDSVQPELDALNRAVRRYEKKLALLANQMDVRLEYLDARLSDAVALAAVAAKNSASQESFGSWLVEKTVTILMFPIQATVVVATFPFRTVSSLLGRTSRSASDKHHRSGRSGRSSGSSRSVDRDRVPARVSRR